jgi:hypothetical protein
MQVRRGRLLKRQGLNVGVHRSKFWQRVDELHLPSGDFVLGGGPREVAEYEPALGGVLADVHELELKRRLDRDSFTHELAQNRFVGLYVGPQRCSIDRERMVRGENPKRAGVASAVDRRRVGIREPHDRRAFSVGVTPKALVAANEGQKRK